MHLKESKVHNSNNLSIYLIESFTSHLNIIKSLSLYCHIGIRDTLIGIPIISGYRSNSVTAIELIYIILWLIYEGRFLCS